jgi:hypothetical protein
VRPLADSPFRVATRADSRFFNAGLGLQRGPAKASPQITGTTPGVASGAQCPPLRPFRNARFAGEKSWSSPIVTLGSQREVIRVASYYAHPRPIEEVLELVGLTAKRNERVTRLSGGQQRRLDMAIAFAGDPELPVRVTFIECYLLHPHHQRMRRISSKRITGAIARRSLRPQLQSSTLVKLWPRPTGGTSEPD